MLLPSHSGRAGAHALAAPTSSGSHACPQVAARPHHHYHQASQQQGGPQVLLPPLPLQQQLQQQGRRSHHHRRRHFACEASAGACVAGGACAASAACLKWPSAPWCSKDAHSLRVHASVRAFACVHANHPAPVPPPHQPTERQQQQQPSTSTAIPPADYPRIPGVIAEEPAVSPRAEAQLTLEQYREIYDRLIGVFQVRVLWCRGWGVGAGRARLTCTTRVSWLGPGHGSRGSQPAVHQCRPPLAQERTGCFPRTHAPCPPQVRPRDDWKKLLVFSKQWSQHQTGVFDRWGGALVQGLGCVHVGHLHFS